MTEWKPIKEFNTVSDEDFVLCVMLYKGIIISNEYGTALFIKTFREYDLKNDYTHFIKINKPTL